MLLLLLLLLPLCWAVEVKRPRGVSLSSESLCIAKVVGRGRFQLFSSVSRSISTSEGEWVGQR